MKIAQLFFICLKHRLITLITLILANQKINYTIFDVINEPLLG